MTETANQNPQASITAQAEEAGLRLDRFLATRLPALSRARLQALIAAGHVTINQNPVTESRHKMKAGETVSLFVPEPQEPTPQGEDIPLDVVFEDAHLIVINKPAGLVVHPAAGNWTGTLVNALIAHCGDSLSGVGGVKRPGIVHRLDKDTTGLMVVAKTDAAHQGLSEQFAAHGRDGRLQRAYRAIIWGTPERPRGTIEAPLGRHVTSRLKRAVRTGGKPAITHYEVVEKITCPGNPTLVDCFLETGRTHQIRVHMAHLGHPLLGDNMYGKGFASTARKLSETQQLALSTFGRQALHAWLLGFEHPVTGKQLEFETELAPDMQALIAALHMPSE
jgi:23S rRNA pseudouridine1911/1915/1917 synthase